MAISCDALQVYEGLGHADRSRDGRASRRGCEHRLVGFVPVTQPFSVGDYMQLAHAEIDGRLKRAAADRGGRDRALPAGGPGGAIAGQGAAGDGGFGALVGRDAAPDARSSG